MELQCGMLQSLNLRRNFYSDVFKSHKQSTDGAELNWGINSNLSVMQKNFKKLTVC